MNEEYIKKENLEGAAHRIILKLKEEKQKQAILENTIKEYKQTIEVVSNLTEKVHHKVIIPFSKLAFFEGEIKNTNTIYQNMGCQRFCERTSKNAEAYLRNKQKYYEDKIKIVNSTIDKLTREVELALELKQGGKGTKGGKEEEGVFIRPDGFFEIREHYSSEEEEDTKKEGHNQSLEGNNTKEKEKEEKKEMEHKEQSEHLKNKSRVPRKSINMNEDGFINIEERYVSTEESN